MLKLNKLQKPKSKKEESKHRVNRGATEVSRLYIDGTNTYRQVAQYCSVCDDTTTQIVSPKTVTITRCLECLSNLIHK